MFLHGTFTLARHSVEPPEFVRRWEVVYDSKLELIYDRNIGQPLTAERVIALFVWKNGGPLSHQKTASVTRNYIARLPELATLDSRTSAEAFLRRFRTGGAIWRIFWLHLWAPNRFPIYDQHVHRAMAWIQTGRGEELPVTDVAKVHSYLDRYLPFRTLFADLDSRRVDRALWGCGKCMKALATAPID